VYLVDLLMILKLAGLWSRVGMV